MVVHSEADREAKYVRLADESVCIGPAPSRESYLNMPAIISAAEVTDSEAIHPGYGFLSENADFAERVEKSGFVFIGPRPDTIRLMGDKVSAKRAMIEAGVPVVPGSEGALPDDPQEIVRIGREVGYPVIIKAAGGGGGRGMRVVYGSRAAERRHDDAFRGRRRVQQSRSLYGSSWRIRATWKSRCWPTAAATRSGWASATAPCSAATRRSSRKRRPRHRAPADRAHRRPLRRRLPLGYRGAGTFEFLYENGEFYFIEMNTRIQVEHPVTELITGVDLVQQQILIAAGEVHAAPARHRLQGSCDRMPHQRRGSVPLRAQPRPHHQLGTRAALAFVSIRTRSTVISCRRTMIP